MDWWPLRKGLSGKMELVWATEHTTQVKLPRCRQDQHQLSDCTPWLCAHLFKVALVASRLGCCSDQSLSACLTHSLEANLALPLYKNIPRTHPPFPRRRHGCPVIYICFPHPVKLEWSRAEDDRQPPVQSWSSPFSPFCTHPTCFPPSGPSILLFC